MIHIGSRIKDLIRERGIRQAELANRIGKARQSLNVVLGRRDVGSDWIQMIMEVTDLTAAEIFGEDSNSDSTDSIVEEPTVAYGTSQNSAVLIKQQLQELTVELALAQKDVQRYRELLEEKERLIRVLMQGK